jgi:uncharacterized protein
MNDTPLAPATSEPTLCGALAVFVKTPRLSPVKTRLAAGVGQPSALAFYHASLDALRACLHATPMLACHWAVGEREGMGDPLWQDFPALYTGEGGLGERQHCIYQQLLPRYGKVLLIGADAPQLTPSLLAEALAALDLHDFVIGPAHDGGYYLFGGKVDVALDVWTAVPWSAATTRACMQTLLPSPAFILPALTDVDERVDLVRLQAEMPAPPSLAQARLLGIIDDILSAAGQK